MGLQRDEGPHHNFTTWRNTLEIAWKQQDVIFMTSCEIPWRQGFPAIPRRQCSTVEFLWSSAQTLPSKGHCWWLNHILDALHTREGLPSVYPIASRACLSIRLLDRFQVTWTSWSTSHIISQATVINANTAISEQALLPDLTLQQS